MDRLFGDVYKDLLGSRYLKIEIHNKRKIKSFIKYFLENGIEVSEVEKLNGSYLFYKVKKTTKRNTLYKLNDNIITNSCDSIDIEIIKTAIRHFDSVLTVDNNKMDSATIFLKIGKLSKGISEKSLLLKIHPYHKLNEQDSYSLICFDNIKVVNTITDYLPIVYYSNSVRYKEILKKSELKIKDILEKYKKDLVSEDYDINVLNACLLEHQELEKMFKTLLSIDNKISYRECVNFNERCTRLNSKVNLLINDVSFNLKNKALINNDSFNLTSSRNDCVFYRGSTKFIYNCQPKLFRDNSAALKLEDITFREYSMRFPDMFRDKTNIESITMMQHFECPTRLLDITTNPLVALYMACYSGFSKSDDSNYKGEVIIFFPSYNKGDNEIKYYDSIRVALISGLTRIDYEEKYALKRMLDFLRTNSLMIKDVLSEDFDFSNLLNKSSISKETQNGIFENGIKALKHLVISVKREMNIDFGETLVSDLLKSYYVKTPFNNDRIRAQSGCFILCGLDENYVDNKFSSSRNNSDFYRIIINDKQNILNELSQINIHQASMTPDMVNVAQHLTKNKY